MRLIGLILILESIKRNHWIWIHETWSYYYAVMSATHEWFWWVCFRARMSRWWAGGAGWPRFPGTHWWCRRRCRAARTRKIWLPCKDGFFCYCLNFIHFHQANGWKSSMKEPQRMGASKIREHWLKEDEGGNWTFRLQQILGSGQSPRHVRSSN